MSYSWNTKQTGWSLLGAVTLLAALLIVLFRVGNLGAQEDTKLDIHGKTILYLASDTSREADPLLESREAESHDLMVVHDFAELQELKDGNPEIGAIIINGSRVDDLDTNWMQDVYNQRVVVAGLNIKMPDLAQLVGDTAVAQDPSWATGDGWQQEPYFSMLSYGLTGTAEEQERAKEEGLFLGVAIHNTDNIVDGDFGLFFHLIDTGITVLGEEQ